jgi:hypothetical protein
MSDQGEMTGMLDDDQFFHRRFHYVEVLYRNGCGCSHVFLNSQPLYNPAAIDSLPSVADLNLRLVEETTGIASLHHL